MTSRRRCSRTSASGVALRFATLPVTFSVPRTLDPLRALTSSRRALTEDKRFPLASRLSVLQEVRASSIEPDPSPENLDPPDPRRR